LRLRVRSIRGSERWSPEPLAQRTRNRKRQRQLSSVTPMSLLNLEPLSSRTTKGDLLRFLCEQGGLDRGQVGRIDIQGRTATIEVPPARLARVVQALDGASLNDRKLRAWS